MIDSRVTDLLYDWAVGRLALPDVERRAEDLAYGPAFGLTEPGQQTPELQVLLAILCGFYDRETGPETVDGNSTSPCNTTVHVSEVT